MQAGEVLSILCHHDLVDDGIYHAARDDHATVIVGGDEVAGTNEHAGAANGDVKVDIVHTTAGAGRAAREGGQANFKYSGGVAHAHIGNATSSALRLHTPRQQIAEEALTHCTASIEDDDIPWLDGLDGLVGMAREEGLGCVGGGRDILTPWYGSNGQRRSHAGHTFLQRVQRHPNPVNPHTFENGL